MRRFLFALFFFLVPLATAQTVDLTGSLRLPGSAPLLCGTNVTLASDADYTLLPAQYCNSINVISGVSLTATRQVIAPLYQGGQFTITNATTGGKSIQFIGASGAGVLIPNGKTLIVNSPDGTKYVAASSTDGGVTSVNGHTGAVTLGSADIPNNAANTSGMAAALSNASLLPDGTTAVTQPAGTSGNRVATVDYVNGETHAASLTVSTIIAASNSINKAYANYVATGVDDQNIINQAIAANCSVGVPLWDAAVNYLAFDIANYPHQGGPLALYNGQVWQPLQASTNVAPVAGPYWQLYDGPKIDQCAIKMLPGDYYISDSIVFNQISQWNILGTGHVMWGGYINAWQPANSITSGSCSSNVCTFAAGSVNSTTRPLVLMGFSGSGAVLNHKTVVPSSYTGSSMTVTVPGAGTIASTGGGLMQLVTGWIGTGGAIIHATEPNVSIIKVQNSPWGCGPEAGRCRGWRVESLYGVCYGYTGYFIDAASLSTDDNIQVNDNTIQRCMHGVVGAFDSPSFSRNSFQDNMGDFFHQDYNATGYLTAYDNLIYDNQGYAYNLPKGGRGLALHDRAWGDLDGGVVGGFNGASIGGFIASGFRAAPVINLNGDSNVITGFVMNPRGYDKCLVMNGNGNSITGNVCDVGGDSISSDDAMTVSGSGNAIAANAFTGVTSTGVGVEGHALNASSCASCTVLGNVIPGVWNFGGSPLLTSPTSVVSGNLAATKSNQGIAPINSAYLITRLQASNATPASNGPTITAWTDSSGLGAHVDSFHGIPSYTTSGINSLPAITFPGTTDTWVSSNAPATGTATPQQRIMWIVAQQSTSAATTGSQNIFSEGVNGSRNIFFGGGNNLCVYAGGIMCSGAQSTGVPLVIEVVMNGASSKIVVNGTPQVTGTLSDTTSYAGYDVGDKAGGGQPFYGLIAEVAEYNGGASSTYTTADAQALGAAYCSTYGVSCATAW